MCGMQRVSFIQYERGKQMKVKTSELTGKALDWAVGTADQCELAPVEYSSKWQFGGAIIEREHIELEHDGFRWWARIWADDDYQGTTPLIAAMRCYVASKLGNEVEVEIEGEKA